MHADVVPGADARARACTSTGREWGTRRADGFSGRVGPEVYNRFFRLGHAVGIRKTDK